MIPLRGEATAQLGDRTLTLVLDNNAWGEIEEVLDLSYIDLLAKLAASEIAGRAPKNRVMRAVLWGATRAHHPELTLDQCGDLLMLHPDLHGPLSEAMVRSTRSAEPVAEDDAPGEAKPAKGPAKKRSKSPAN
jgi:hypothetical protein